MSTRNRSKDRAVSRGIPRSGGWSAAGVGLLLILHALSSVGGAARKGGITYDEHAHLPAGVSYWKERDFRLNPEHPPLPKLVAGAGALLAGAVWPPDDREWIHGAEWYRGGLPGTFTRDDLAVLKSFYAEWWFGRAWLYHYNGHQLDRVMLGSRIAMTSLSVILGVVVFFAGYRMRGVSAGMIALVLYALCPNITGHAPLATTDMCYTLFQTIHLFAMIGYLNAGGRMPGRGNLLWWCASVVGAAGAMLSKYSAPVAFAVTPGLMLIGVFKVPKGERGAWLRSTLAGITLMYGTAGVPCELAYQAVFGVHFAPMWTFGFRLVRSGILKSDIYYFMGEYGKRAPLYFMTTWLLKLTLPAVLMTAAGLLMSLRVRRDDWDSRVTSVGVFVAWYVLVLSAVFPLLGVRYLLPALVPGYVLAGVAGAGWFRSRRGRIVVYGLLAAHAVSSISAWPQHIAYMNILTAPRGKAHYLGDSNLDWGENLPALRRYLESRGRMRIQGSLFGMGPPEYYGIECEELTMATLHEPAEGDLIVISSRFLYESDTEVARALDLNWRLTEVVADVYYVFEPSA